MEKNQPTVGHGYEMVDQAVESLKYFLGNRFPDFYRYVLVAIVNQDDSKNTEKSYLGSIIRFRRFHPKKLPGECSNTEPASFLEHLAFKRKASGSTQRLILSALAIFLLHGVLPKIHGHIKKGR
ncbi:MAG: phage integrase N-terminal SAM-like domain-containing protein [Candidatus Thiodiazotropha sp. (ex Codakia rugifera)]|nr:phage integrase N-terminal SAM-like domain-containing protein [Candidatus Thiodiazotropha sp. (ex Codakia rugifera)]